MIALIDNLESAIVKGVIRIRVWLIVLLHPGETRVTVSFYTT